MPSLTPVSIAPLLPERFREVLGDDYAPVEAAIERAGLLFEGRVIWHVNSTATGGGVAELLHSLLAYTRGAGVDARWMVLGGSPEFFRITKRIHNNLHGFNSDGGTLGDAEMAEFERISGNQAEELAALVQPGDVVYLHDPQTAGMLPRLSDSGATVIWRCHIGIDSPNDVIRAAWDWLRPLVEGADCYVFSRREYAWDGLDPERIAVIAPSIDAFSPKNQDLDPAVARAILGRIGLCDPDGVAPTYTRQDGTPARVDRQAKIDQEATLPGDAPVLTQVSRWDRLKDPVGVLRGFAEHVANPDAHALLVGPDVDGVSDDPEGAEVLAEVRAARAELDPGVRARTHLVNLPMDDIEENAAMVNAIQRHSTVVAQKSLAEGFGLTATEAMWKGRPVIATAVGGLGEQVLDGVTGTVIADPRDLRAFGAAAEELLSDRALADRLGEAGREHVRANYLGTRHLMEYVDLLGAMLAGSEPG
ncbi:MAG TPA: glycosyltransferase [Solirubrobacterales bacterium]|nr:glycosyltransferase [Solirubrobacterales bacterium]